MTRELVDRMREALGTMDPLTRTVFERVRLDGQDYLQIANALSLTVPDVEQRFADALLHIWIHLDRADLP